MSFWAILFVFLAIVMAVGPIMLMQPSKRDRKLAALRQAAAQSGLIVRMTDYQQGQDKQAIAVYYLTVDLPENTPSWQLVKQEYQHDVHFYKEWEWQDKTPELQDSQKQQLQSFLNGLPADIVGLEMNSRQIGLWWREVNSKLTVDDIQSFLKRCGNIFE